MSDHFTTEFGHRIDFVPGYFERNRYYADDALTRRAAYFARTVETWQRASTIQKAPNPTPDWVQFSATTSFLIRHDLFRKWKSVIDLGGGEGMIARLFKAAGLAERATNLDLDDYSALCPQEYFDKWVDVFRAPMKYDGPSKDLIHSSARKFKYYFDHFPEFPTFFGLYQKFPNAPALDENLLISLFDAPGQHDLVISFSTLDFFDLDEILPKVRDLLTPDGMFVCSVNSHWWPASPGGVIGHFPFMLQRLTEADVERYYAAHQPEFNQHIHSRYNHYHQGHQRPTLADWFAYADKHGLKIVAYERVISRQHERVEVLPVLLRKPWFDIKDVMRDVHTLRPDVTIDELMTSAFRLAMVRA